MDHLGWLDLPAHTIRIKTELEGFAQEVAEAGYKQVAVIGMGGSSLASEVFASVFRDEQDRLPLQVVDSTHPMSIRAADASFSAGRTLFIVSSKSGTTLETMSLFKYFWSQAIEQSEAPGENFVAITRPGTPLAQIGQTRNFRRIFHAPGNVGGRYSALTEFGMVPAAAIGAPLSILIRGATNAATQCGPDMPIFDNPGLVLGAFLSECTLHRRDKATFLSTVFKSFVPWIEQLVAESTGKSGTGIVPVGGDEDALSYGTDRMLISLGHKENNGLSISQEDLPTAQIFFGEEDLLGVMFIFEVAVAVTGASLRIHPFNQPDVQLAKQLTHRAITAKSDSERVAGVTASSPDLADQIRNWSSGSSSPDYLAVQAYIPRTNSTQSALNALRRLFRDSYGIATTVEFGPRFLHSTGQLHKGGPATGRFLQIVDEPAEDIPVPDTGFTFGGLIQAQADGDYRALESLGRRVLRVSLGSQGGDGLASLLAAAQTAIE